MIVGDGVYQWWQDFMLVARGWGKRLFKNLLWWHQEGGCHLIINMASHLQLMVSAYGPVYTRVQERRVLRAFSAPLPKRTDFAICCEWQKCWWYPKRRSKTQCVCGHQIAWCGTFFKSSACSAFSVFWCDFNPFKWIGCKVAPHGNVQELHRNTHHIPVWS